MPQLGLLYIKLHSFSHSILPQDEHILGRRSSSLKWCHSAAEWYCLGHGTSSQLSFKFVSELGTLFFPNFFSKFVGTFWFPMWSKCGKICSFWRMIGSRNHSIQFNVTAETTIVGLQNFVAFRHLCNYKIARFRLRQLNSFNCSILQRWICPFLVHSIPLLSIVRFDRNKGPIWEFQSFLCSGRGNFEWWPLLQFSQCRSLLTFASIFCLTEDQIL